MISIASNEYMHIHRQCIINIKIKLALAVDYVIWFLLFISTTIDHMIHKFTKFILLLK